MGFSNTATPYYYGLFRDAVLRGEIPVNKEIAIWKKSENPQKLIRFEKSCSRRSLIRAALKETGRK